MSSPRLRVLKAVFVVTVLLFAWVGSLKAAHGRWTELNIGPFVIDSESDSSRARDMLARLEQARWVLGGLLEIQNLQAAWPFRILLTDAPGMSQSCRFVSYEQGGQGGSQASGSGRPFGFVPQPEQVTLPWQNAVVLHAQYTLICPSGAQLPLGQIMGLLLDANTVRLPTETELGLTQLFDTLQASGSRVTWGGPPPHPDLAAARMQLFATKFEYSASFHIFLSALKGGSSLRSAEGNAFGRPADELEKEAASLLASNDWKPASVSGRPLNPKRDFGERSVDDTEIQVYLADARLPADKKGAKSAYQAAVAAGGSLAPLGYEGLAQLDILEGVDPTKSLDAAAEAKSRSAPVYFASAEDLPTERMIALLQRAEGLNARWAEPVFRQAQETEDKGEREALIKKATEINPRETKYWIELAKAQIANGHASVAQGSWLRAEESGATEQRRDEIHQMRIQNEAGRLDAAEKARADERNATRHADQQAQQSQADRIRAAEAKANAALDAEAGGRASGEVIPWSQVVPKKELKGELLRIDCQGKNARLLVNERGRHSTLLLKDVSASGLSCGEQKPALPVTLTYAAQADESLRVDGTVLTLRVGSSR